MKRLTGLLTDPIYLEHDTGQHPENANRLKAIINELKSSDIWDQLEKIPAEKADRAMIELIHDPEYIDYIEREIKSGAPFVGTMDCMVCPKTFEVAEYAVGGALSLVKQVESGQLKNGFALVRPPGHHAEKRQALGFCYFNNIAICAEYLIKHKLHKRILIMDFDVHHGNGTQHSFESRSDLFYCSIHENPTVCYPGTGFETEIGFGDGKGYTLNVPMRSFSGDDRYLEVLEKTFIPAWRNYKPDFILVSAGYDAHKEDPLARINITDISYKEYTEALCKVAEEFCGGKLVSFLEGGYNLEVIPRLVLAHLRILLQFAHLG
jgi:acetoin utilization deacetylase AcuC-like enzyme